MPTKRGFEAELAELETLRDAGPAAAEKPLAAALRLKNNFLVAKAAALAQHHDLRGLVPLMAEAFPRFIGATDQESTKLDLQCWAKNALAKALAHFEYQEPDPFRRGMRHIQREPVWGGDADTAGPLRGTCALALVQCRGVRSHDLLIELLPLFSDKEVPVQVNAARAVEQIGTDSAALILRLRAELGSGEPELLGQCYSGVLSIEGASAIPWAARFLAAQDDTAGEAALAIAGTHTPEAFTTLSKALEFSGRIRTYREDAHRGDAEWFRTVLLSAIALTRQPEAIGFLLNLVEQHGSDADDAHDALCRGGPSEETRARLAAMGRPCP